MNIKKIIIFLALLFLVSYSFEFLIYPNILDKGFAQFSLMLLMWVPTLLVIIVQKFIYKEKVFTKDYRFQITFSKWLFISILLPIVIVALIIIISVNLPGYDLNSYSEYLKINFSDILTDADLKELNVMPEWLLVLSMLFNIILSGVTINALLAFGEEFAWRGFLQTELKSLGFWPSSIIIGTIWGLWHAGLIYNGYNFSNYNELGIVYMTIGCIGLGVLFSYITVKSGSVIAPALAHGVFNAVAGATYIYIIGYHELITSVFGIVGFAVYLFFIILIFIFDRRVVQKVEYEKDVLTDERYLDY